MGKNSFFYYYRIQNKRMKRDKIYLSLKSFIDLFTERDRKLILNTLLYILNLSTVFLVIFQTLLYFTISILLGNAISIYLNGLLSLIFALFLFFSKYKNDKIEYLKKELSLLIQHSLKYPNKTLVKLIMYDAYINILIACILPYSLAVIAVVLLTKSSLNFLVLGLLFCCLNSFISIMCVHFKVANTASKKIIYFLLPILCVLIIPFVYILRFIDFKLLKVPNIYNNFLNYNLLNKVPVDSIYLLLLTLILTGCVAVYQFVFLRSSNYIRNILVPFQKVVNIVDYKFYKYLYHTYQFLIVRAFLSKNKLLNLKIWSILLSLVVVLLYPLLTSYFDVVVVINILLFCYTPSIIMFVISIMLYDELLIRKNIYTNYYLIKKYNIKKNFIKQTSSVVLLTIAFYLILPQIIFLILYQPINPFIGIISYIITCLVLIHILIMRMYEVDKYTIEQILILESTTLTSKSVENMLIFGIPIIYAIPFIVVYFTNSLNIYILFIPYTLFICIYYGIKYTLLSGRKSVSYVKNT